MNQDSDHRRDVEGLRQEAEKQLRKARDTEQASQTPAQAQRILHELQVHQIELEMQNEELLASRAQAESALQRYTELYDFAPVGYFTLSEEGTIRELNLPGAALLGMERARLIGARFERFVSEPSKQQFKSWLSDVFTIPDQPTCVLTLERPGRARLFVEMNGTPSENGLESRVVASDITFRRELEEQLRQTQKMELIGQLAGGVAHDFNNILAAMMLNLEMLQLENAVSKRSESPFSNLEGLAKRAASLTQQLLLFSRRQAMEFKALEINLSLATLLQMLERLLGEHITCRQKTCPQELWIEADAAMVDQAIMNLCLNARDAMPDGGEITLETDLVEFTSETARDLAGSRAGQFVCVKITDTGSGMCPDVLTHLFEPFFTTKEIGKGTGLGLASTQGIVHQHKGWMNVESTVGTGTTFRLYFPSTSKVKQPALPVSPGIDIRGQNETILLVEDEPALLFITSRALSAFGYQILSATNGVEALDLWNQHCDEVDLLLTDMKMPKGMSGLQLAENIWKIRPSLKVIIMSGYSMEIMQDNKVGHPTYVFLPKPFPLKTLGETVRRCLDECSSTR